MKRVETEEQARRHTPPHTSAIFKEPHDPAYCCASVYGARVTHWQCNRKPKIWYGSLGYCSTHDPNAQIAKKAAQDEKYQSRWAADMARYDHEAAMREYTAACVELVEAASSLDLDTHPSSFADLGVIVKNMKRIVAKKPASAEAQGE